ncbi:MAG TPA: efflux RND transporter permease subunit [Candidatus Omnitrophota bacterium]|nr:efflux RND transporter permease subunit [Candidatus Omnitrophota bacterium]
MGLPSIPDFSVKRPITVWMFYLGVLLLGAIAFTALPVEMMPNVSFGDITINIDVRGGMPASEVEKRITKLVEEAVGSVTHLKDIIAISKEGNATIILEFEPGTNMDFAALEVREKFNRIRNKLPPEIEKPVVAKYEYMDVPIMIIALTSPIRTPEQLRKIVDEKVKDRIQRIEGVANAEIAGGREGKVIIEVDQRKLQSYGLPINRIVDIINLNNENALAGEIKGARNKYLVRTIGEFKTLDDIANLAIATTEKGSVIRVKDVATVKDSYLDPVSFSRMNANPVVSIYVQKESTANTVRISKLVKEEIAKLRQILESDIQVNLTFNQADVIQQAVAQVKSSLITGALLAVAVLLVFLGDLRLVFIIATCIPVSLLLTFVCMYFSKLSLNVISLSGLALGVGMLIDNAVVVLDNTFKKRQRFAQSQHPDPEHWEQIAAMEGADEMVLAITASTLTTIIVFLPIVWINPEIQKLYSGIALTISFSLIASLLTAISLVPMLLTKIRIRNKAPADPFRQAHPVVRAWRAMAGFGQNIYRGFISISLALRYLLVILAALGFMRALQESNKLEKEFIGIAEQNKFTIFIEMPTGTKLDVSNAVVQKVEDILKNYPDIKTATAKIEPWSSKIFVEMVPFGQRKMTTAQMINELRPHTEKMDPAFIYYEEPEEVGTKEIILELFGYDYDVLKNLAIQVAQRIQTIPKFTDTKIRMREGRPELHLYIDKRQAAYFGLSVESIALALHTNTRGLVATRYRGSTEPIVRIKETPDAPGSLEESAMLKIPRTASSPNSLIGKETETIVRLEEQFRKSFEALRRTTFVTPDGHMIFLSQLANFKFDLGPSEIWRKNKARMVQVSANTGGTALGTAADNVIKALKEVKFPKDYFWQIGGNYDKMLRNQQELGFALLLSLILVYMILASLFESMSEPFIILATVPLAAIGAIIALRYTNKPVGTGVLIGSIILGGIVVNNAIVLIDRINFMRKKPEYAGNVRSVIVEASLDRLRPIMMTSLTTILGLIPMAIDKSESANLWSPLAITVIGGLTLSTALTLFVIPCVYLVFCDFRLIKK